MPYQFLYSHPPLASGCALMQVCLARSQRSADFRYLLQLCERQATWLKRKCAGNQMTSYTPTNRTPEEKRRLYLRFRNYFISLDRSEKLELRSKAQVPNKFIPVQISETETVQILTDVLKKFSSAWLDNRDPEPLDIQIDQIRRLESTGQRGR